MGLFSNKKKGCPICGEPTPRLFPTKVEGAPICKECAAKANYLPPDAIDDMSTEDFAGYIEFYEENAALRKQFKETHKYGGGFFDAHVIRFDENNRLLRIHGSDDGIVFSADNIVSFNISEDDILLFEGDADSLRCYETETVYKVEAMEELVERFLDRRQDYENAKALRDMLDKDDDKPNYDRTREPQFTNHEPFKQFEVTLVFDHPYWEENMFTIKSPQFDIEEPSIRKYLRDYEEAVKELRELAELIQGVINPDAPVEEYELGEEEEETAAPAAAPVSASASAKDIAEALQKFNELLYMGAITEEEFAAKKKQLLGL